MAIMVRSLGGLMRAIPMAQPISMPSASMQTETADGILQGPPYVLTLQTRPAHAWPPMAPEERSLVGLTGGLRALPTESTEMMESMLSALTPAALPGGQRTA